MQHPADTELRIEKMSKFEFLSAGVVPPANPNLLGKWVIALPKTSKRRHGDYVESV